MEKENKKLGFGALAGIIFGMVVGSGLYNIPQNLAATGGPVSVLIGWAIIAGIMLLLVCTLKILADHRPDLNAGIYEYAAEGFGGYTGFNIAWGYWLCTSFANVAYDVMLNDSLGAFFPALLNHGWETFVFGSVLIWGAYFLVVSGIRTASFINNIMAVIKMIAIVLIVVLLFINMKISMFTANVEQDLSAGTVGIWDQIKNSMLVTLWCFIGIEGAVMIAARAKRSSDVGKATVTGFLSSWLLYVLVSVLCFGVMSRVQLSDLSDPSSAYVLKDICGEWAYYFVIISVIISLLGSLLAWTIICAEVPYEAAVAKIFPKSFMKLNKHGMPAFGLFVSSMAMQVFLMLVMMAHDVYMAALQITGMMVLPAYLTSGLYLMKASLNPDMIRVQSVAKRRRYLVIGILCAFLCGWIIYAGGVDLFIYTSVFYVIGTGFYIKTRSEGVIRMREAGAYGGKLPFTTGDRVTLAILIIGIALTVWYLSKGYSPV